MESHPVPQSITSYEFKLVGDMTLKQFGQLALGVVMGLISYSLPIHPIFKWPLVIFFGLVGVLLAFVPFQERPLSSWIVAFFKAVYTPTQFLWEKKVVVPEYFTVVARREARVEKVETGEEVAAGEVKVRAYLASLPQTQQLSELEKVEREMLAQINQLLTEPMTLTEKREGEEMAKIEVKKEEVVKAKVVPSKPVKLEEKPGASKPGVKLPTPVTITAAGRVPSPLFEKQKAQITKAASFAPEAPIPNLPSLPGVVVGQVIDKYGRIIANAIVEIKDEKGVPMRALRTNKLGHFQIVTPLPGGKYTIETEKEGFRFDTISVELKGEIVPPISIIGEIIGERESEKTEAKPVMIYQTK